MKLKLFIKCHFTIVISCEAIVSNPIFIDFSLKQSFRETFRNVLRNM